MALAEAERQRLLAARLFDRRPHGHHRRAQGPGVRREQLARAAAGSSAAGRRLRRAADPAGRRPGRAYPGRFQGRRPALPSLRAGARRLEGAVNTSLTPANADAWVCAGGLFAALLSVSTTLPLLARRGP